MSKSAYLMFHSLAIRGVARGDRHVSIKREGGLYLVIITRDGQTRTEEYPNRAQAYQRAHAMGAV